MKLFVAAIFSIFAACALAQTQKVLIEAPDFTQGRPNTSVFNTYGIVQSVYSETMQVTTGYTCPQNVNNNECFPVVEYVPIFIHRIKVAGIVKDTWIEFTGVRSRTKYAVNARVDAKIQLNYFIGNLD